MVSGALLSHPAYFGTVFLKEEYAVDYLWFMVGFHVLIRNCNIKESIQNKTKKNKRLKFLYKKHLQVVIKSV